VKQCVVLLAFVAAACGGSGSDGSEPVAGEAETAAAAAAPKACNLLTRADAEKALGREVQQLPNDGGPAGLDICQYGYQGERMMDAGNASVTVQPVDIASLRKGVEEQGYAVEEVAGLGDSAFWSNDVGLYVGKGNRTAIYLVRVGGEGEAQSKERAIALAKATVARL